MATVSTQYRDIVLKRRVTNLLRVLSRLNFDTLFFRAEDGGAMKFSDIFPPGSYSVVGNSPVLLDNEVGEEIDKNDYIVRFSDYKIEGFEQHVGSRTSLWVTQNGNQLPEDAVPLLYLPTHYKNFQSKKDVIAGRYGQEYVNSFVIFHNDQVLRTIRTSIGSIPSVGLVILLLLSVRYREIQPYGFSMGFYKGQYHYVNKRARPDTTHDWAKERKIYLFLAESGLFKKGWAKNTTKVEKPVRRKKKERYFPSNHVPKHISSLYKARHQERTYTPKVYTQTLPTNNTSTQERKNTSTDVLSDTNHKIDELVKFLTTT